MIFLFFQFFNELPMDIHTNASIEDITRQHNSSPNMATKRYMKRIGQQRAVELHERIYSKQK